VGGHHRYSFEDLVTLKAVRRLIDAGISVQRIRNGIRMLREALRSGSRPLGELTLIATGDLVLVLPEQSDFEVLHGHEWIFPISEFRREIDARAEDHRRKSKDKHTRGGAPNFEPNPV
jgi:DNA-binding transcriptional MerR regulator